MKTTARRTNNKTRIKLIALTSLGLATLLGGGGDNQKEDTKMDTIYQFTAKGRNGTSLDLASLKGKVLLIINTATGCGFTPQYTGLEQLYAKWLHGRRMMRPMRKSPNCANCSPSTTWQEPRSRATSSGTSPSS